MSGIEIEVSVNDGETNSEEQEAAEAVAQLLNPPADQQQVTGTGRRIIQGRGFPSMLTLSTGH